MAETLLVLFVLLALVFQVVAYRKLARLFTPLPEPQKKAKKQAPLQSHQAGAKHKPVAMTDEKALALELEDQPNTLLS
jgi:hypothetical protein